MTRDPYTKPAARGPASPSALRAWPKLRKAQRLDILEWVWSPGGQGRPGRREFRELLIGPLD